MSSIKLADYDISMKTAFLQENPLTRLPPYYDAWNNVALCFDELVLNQTIREEVKKLPLLDISQLNGDKEIKLAHMQLVMMSNGYLYMEGPPHAPTVLPKNLAVPLYGLYEKHGLRPVVTYPDVLLNNCTLRDANGRYQIENITSIITTPSPREEWDWFIGVSAMVEYEFGKACQPIQDILDGIEEGDEEMVAISLTTTKDVLGEMKVVMKRFHEKLTTESFFPKMTGYWLGYGDNALFDGLTFEGVDVPPVKERTANAGQTPTLKVLDALLNITHTKERQADLDDITRYLQPKHREFIHAIKTSPKQLRPFVEGSSSSSLKDAYKAIVQEVVNWRTYHVQLVTKYMLQAVKKNLPEPVQEQMRPSLQKAMELVKGARDDTKESIPS